MSFLLLGGRRCFVQSSLALSRITRPAVVSRPIVPLQRYWFSDKTNEPENPITAATTTDTTTDLQEADATKPSKSSKKKAKRMSASEQHTAWVEFQKRIAVDGFETGQTTAVVNRGRRRPAKMTKLSENQRKIMERQRLTGTGGGEFPPLRYSEEETLRLLKEAYAAVPLRTGRRGHRNAKRQEKRWRLVREIHAKRKRENIAAHERRMVKRAKKAREVKEIKATAEGALRSDREYQLSLYKRWMENHRAATLLAENSGGVGGGEAAAEMP